MVNNSKVSVLFLNGLWYEKDDFDNIMYVWIFFFMLGGDDIEKEILGSKCLLDEKYVFIIIIDIYDDGL